MCKILKVSRSGFYAWRDRKPSRRTKNQMKLIEQITESHAKSRRSYGSPRITMELKADEITVCENTVAKYMRQAELKATIKKRFVPQTTDSNHPHPIAPNRLDRDFTAEAPNQKWVGDITCIWTDEGWLFLAVIIDLFSRKIVGWNMSQSPNGELTAEALKMAIKQRRPGKGLLHHSDRGVQYACQFYQQLLSQQGFIPSMSRTGNCYDNAVAESFFGTLKSEHVHHQRYATREQARSSLFEWINVFYNRQRRHSTLGYLSPEAFEAQIN
jgi:transposase InsO family protein